MKLQNTPIALAAIALLGAAPFAAEAAPTVYFSAPQDGATISQDITQTSQCEVTGQRISSVTFSLRRSGASTWTTLNIEGGAPYRCNLDPRDFPNGQYTLRAVARDSAGATATATRNITLSGSTANTPPTLSISAPASGATVKGTVSCGASASDSNGIRQVQFYLDGSSIGTDTGSPYTCSFDSTKLSNGSHTLRAVATDTLGGTSSTQVSFSVNNAASGAPTISFTAPSAGGVLKGNVQGPPNCTVTGTNIARVMFYLNDVWTNTDGNGSNGWGCWIDTTKYKDGAYTVKAIAYNAAGQTTTVTHPITIQNAVANTPPSVSIIQPNSGATLSAPVNGSGCEANAADPGGSIKKVEFFLSKGGTSTPVGSKTAAPYQCAIDTAKFADGDYTLMAVATDNLDMVASAQRAVTIKKSGSGGGGTSPIAAADILLRATADLPFSQQSGYTAQVIGTYTSANAIPESGINGSMLPNGETLRLGKSADPMNSAAKALSFQVSPSDPNTSGSKRAELSVNPNIEMNKVYWVALSVYVTDWGTLSDSDQGLFGTQMHSGNNSLGLSPSFGIYTSNSGRNFKVSARWSTSSSPSQGNSTSAHYADQPIPFGQWTDFVFRFKHNTSGNGFLQVWMNGAQIVNHAGNLGFNTPGYKDYAKFGYYNWSGSNMSSPRKVLLRSPTIVADPSGSTYSADQVRTLLAQ